MNIIVHYPAGAEAKKELEKRIALAHGSAILKYIEQLPCPVEQKKEILSEIIQKM